MQQFQDEDQILFEAIEAYRNGNGDKATVIYEKTKKYTYKILHQEVERFKSQSILTGDAISITEDVMQDLYIDFFNKIANFRNEDPKSIFKWISVVSHRMLLDYVDKNKMEVLQFEKDDDFREENDIWDSSEINDADLESNHELLPEAALEDKEFQQLILDFIQSLPEAQAQTVLLHFRGGMKYQEIADEMGVSLITVKTRMKKAKDSLEEIINKYEKKTGTKLHSVSILPLLWLLYRMSSESTTVPVAVDVAVTGSVAGASSIATTGSIVTVGTTAATKAVSTRVLIAIVSTAVAIGGVAVGSQIVEKKQENDIRTEQEDLEENGSDDNQQNNDNDTSSKVDNDTSNKGTDEGNSENNQNETVVEDNGNDTNNTGSDNNVTQDSNGAGTNTNVTGSNTGNASGNEESGNSSGSGDNSGNEDASGSEEDSDSGDNGNDSGSEDIDNGDSGSETTAAKGTKENPYRIGDKIVGKQVHGSNTELVDVEFTITNAYSLEEGLALTGDSYSSSSYVPIVEVTYEVTGTEGEDHNSVAMSMFAVGDEKTESVAFLWENVNGFLKNNTVYSLRFHTKYATESTEYKYLRVAFAGADGYFRDYFYIALY